jgi:hypothetical protein
MQSSTVTRAMESLYVVEQTKIEATEPLCNAASGGGSATDCIALTRPVVRDSGP